MTTTFCLNGERFQFFGDPMTPLVDVLRYHKYLTGSKAVCREGFCGACIVHIGGVAANSCLKPVGLLEGRDVWTIEGASALDPHVQRLQAAFEEMDVVQCGMCFPGMVMSMSRLLAEGKVMDRAAVKAAMTGNICRCTGYERIVDAIMSRLGAPADE